ncbi:chromosome segregation protein SMC [Alkalibacillus haloalkaliphilus]|uniref:chromosome segregation protein SMC n=1 Tax=Alkalibacillus haloalkaliphilus TaxID=94136 RepID=UPI00293580B1|nr:chromosome segregation protein SMC [Alkalibacillus haloalkaliphilus]MDV2580570.1 chromosome segregation protein SMC [Alkalibacillus haloalkaliphilus]
MFLKRLETVGFKSFAERVSVDFVPGVTAVVGPNGSGKSNITDAIRWVLGEQSAKSLRGAKMEDVIFSGSDTRKGLNVADVTLVLDNRDHQLPIEYDEVAVTRRVYRSGDSDYLINKQPCRLKDITDLFMDSGLGKEAFSIISQGKVEEILSSKSEERRSIFEEAAGVLKYKKRKVHAQKKLSETQDNLSRVEDIIHEIEGQLEPLEKQAETAKQYLELRDQLEKEEVSLLVAEIEAIHTDWDHLLTSIEHLKEQLAAEKAVIQQDDANLEEKREIIHSLEKQINKWQDEKLYLTKEIEQLEGQKNVLAERLKHFDESKDKLESNVQTHSDHVDQIKLDIEDHEARLAVMQSSRNETKQQIKALKDRLASSEGNIEETIEQHKAEYIDLLNEQAASRNEKHSVEKQIEQIEERKKRLDERFDQMIQDRESLQTEFNEYEQQKIAFEQQLTEVKQAYERLETQLNDQQETIYTDEEKLNQAYRIIEQLRSKKEMLEDMKESYSGFYYGVKAILQAKERSQLNGVHGAVAQLIQVPQDYVTAMETALGAQAQHIVVSTDKDARDAIQYLKQSKSGRATLLPQSTMKSRLIDERIQRTIQNADGFIGVASQLVNFDESYREIAENLLGNVIVTHSLKEANAVAKQINHRYRIVTLDGDVVNPGGSMSGGAKKNSNQVSLFTREQELDEIKEKLTNYESKTETFQEELKQKRSQLDHLKGQLTNKEEELTQVQSSYQEVNQKLQSAEIQLSNMNKQLEVYDQENQQFEQDRQNLKQQLTTLESTLVEQSNKSNELKQIIDDLTENQSSYKAEQDEQQEQLNNLQIRLAEQDSDVRNQEERVNQLKADLEEEVETKTQTEKELKDLKESHEKSHTVEGLTESLQNHRNQLVRVNSQLEEAREKREQEMQLQEDLEREIKEKNRLYEEKSSQLQKYEVQANRLDVDLENRLQQLSDEYSMTFERAKQVHGPAEDIEEAKQQVAQTKQQIKSLGHVNIGSIEEYERVQERYAFLTDQRDDLLEAKETLHSIIDEMDEEMVRKFSETFFKIQEEFEKVFKELFGGGHAELKLTNPDDLLETGVDIIAQPPGKKLQQLGLLSGGERALTAIALLFAILRVRPVPFCVLDEVEAALDEANVVRFAGYLKQFSAQTQFIVITHRKGTMEHADVLYGVTMQESGVSKMVSVKLEETEEMIYN